MEIQSITPELEEKGLRLDKVILNHMPDRSRTEIQKWIKAGQVIVNDNVDGLTLRCLEALFFQKKPFRAKTGKRSACSFFLIVFICFISKLTHPLYLKYYYL